MGRKCSYSCWKLMHQKVHDPYLTEKRKDTILVRALPVSSRIMGVSGECDLVEFHKCEDGIRLHGHRGMYSIYPVEYKKEKQNQQMPIDCSLWHRFYVSKKCFLQQYLKQLFLWRNKTKRSCGNYRGSEKCSQRYI